MEPVISVPYPNPSNGSPISFTVQTSGRSVVKMDIFTLNFRKIFDRTFEAEGVQTVSWNLKDPMGDQVANGVYYVRINITGSQSVTKIVKVLILR